MSSEQNLGVWPAGRALHARSQKEALERQECLTVCGWQGCEETFSGLHLANMEALGAHREVAHPDFVPFKRKRVKRSARRS